ncbi:MAG TPA: hypothetical protein VFD92_17065 [Candidatus Binatia bacterium]|nr:hypothetical protein [Candidatus Binatia bacterium]
MRRDLRLYGLAAIGLATALLLTPALARATCVGGSPNGTLESGEQCDGGSDATDCCTDSCTFAADNTACDDHNDCSVNSKCDASGDCGGGTAAPNGSTCRQRNVDGSPADCKTYLCDAKACTSTVTSDPCSDGNACTQDTCTDPTTNPPTCSPSHPALPPDSPCDTDANACTVEKCDASVQCVLYTTVDCSNASPAPGVCEFYSCNPSSGACVLGDKPKGTSCTSDGNDCTDDECNSRGDCKHFAVNAGHLCSDGNPCTIGEQCNGNKVCGPAGTSYEGTPGNAGGSCADDNNVCTYDYCNGVVSTCQHSSTPYGGGTSTNGNSCPTDNNACTYDICNSGACSHVGTNPFTSETTNGNSCTDANTCTATSACNNGACTGTSCVSSGTCSTFCGNPACTQTLPACGCSG